VSGCLGRDGDHLRLSVQSGLVLHREHCILKPVYRSSTSALFALWAGTDDVFRYLQGRE
jgi:hypothetical protein